MVGAVNFPEGTIADSPARDALHPGSAQPSGHAGKVERGAPTAPSTSPPSIMKPTAIWVWPIDQDTCRKCYRLRLR